MANIEDVARKANVSVATVSRVMNGSTLVAEATSIRVKKAVQELSYVPNQQARNLRKNVSRTILVLLPNITNPYYANVFSGINDKAQKLGYSLYLCSTENRDAEELISDAIENRKADGAILLFIGYDEDWLQKYSPNFPVVQCCEYSKVEGIPRVSVDNYKAGKEVTEYFITLGYSKIGMISAKNTAVSTIQRMKGYKEALESNGIEFNEDYVAYADGDYDYISSVTAAKKVLMKKDRPDALFCIGDSVAMAAVVAASEIGLSVPDDVSIIGFDDIVYTKMIHPYLTTVVQPCRNLGKRSTEILDKLIKGEKLKNEAVTLPHGFVVRESTRPYENNK